MVASLYFHDKQTNRRVMLIGLLFCSAFVFVSFFARPSLEMTACSSKPIV